jgi:PKD domain/Carboxypeptidase regulatory-like domain
MNRAIVAFLAAALALPALAPAKYRTLGERTLLVIRVDFPDLPGDPVPEKKLRKLLDGTEAYYKDNSFGKLTIQSTITPTIRVPKPQQAYEIDFGKVGIDARVAVRAAGFDPSKFDFDAFVFSTHDKQFRDFGAVNAKGLHLGNGTSLGPMCHELGHNLGLPHVQWWESTDGSVIGGAGKWQNYGDIYDWMGAGGVAGAGDDPRCHFSAPLKSQLGWLGPNGYINSTTASGKYRIYAEDLPGDDPPRALRLPRNDNEIYWVEFRQLFRDKPFLMNGVRLLRTYVKPHDPDVLDASPSSPLGREDGGVLIGQTYCDPEAGIYITPVGKGGTTPESVEVVVNRGRFLTNHPPTVRFVSSAGSPLSPAPMIVQPKQDVELQVEASDPDHDELQYSWDFGDEKFDWGKSKVTHRWMRANGQFQVRCVVTDMKGGSASVGLLVVAGTGHWPRISGRVVDTAGRPVADVWLRVDKGQAGITTSDGTFTLPLAPGPQTLTPRKHGYDFSSASVTVGKWSDPPAAPLTIRASKDPDAAAADSPHTAGR